MPHGCVIVSALDNLMAYVIAEPRIGTKDIRKRMMLYIDPYGL